MAEFPQLGNHCNVCQRLDFLPFVCVHCNQVFCKEHREVTIHKCNCIADREISIEQSHDVSKKVIKEKCSFCNEKVTSDLEGSECLKCSKYHCLGHRHPESHDCIKLKEEKLQSAFRSRREAKNISSLTPKGLKGAKNDALAAKVAFMKMKQSAKTFASVPETERVYFKVIFIDCSMAESNKSDPNIIRKEETFIFSKMWSSGRCVDFLADQFKVSNRNNVSKVGSKKLVLSSLNQTNHLELDVTVGKSIENGSITDGDELILEFV